MVRGEHRNAPGTVTHYGDPMDDVAARPPPRRRRWPTIVAGAAVAVSALALIVAPRGDALFFWVIAEVGVGIAAFVGVGAVLAYRRPQNPIGPMLLVAGSAMSVSLALGSYSSAGAAATLRPWAGVAVAEMLSEFLFEASIVVGLIGIPLVFPDGRFLSPPWRSVVGLAVAALGAGAVALLIQPGPVQGLELDNPVGVPGAGPLATALSAWAVASAAGTFLAALGSMWLRFRRGTPVERQQLKWLVVVVAYAALIYPLAFTFFGSDPLGIAGWTVANGSFVALPLGIGIAVLRYRLYEIDRILSRTIGWAIVTAVLVGIFAGLVIGFTALLRPFTGGNGLAVAGATLAVAALFQPLRLRVQRAVDRRFYRRGVDADAIAQALTEHLRDEVNLGSIAGALVGTAEGAVQPTRVSLWLRDIPANRPSALSMVATPPRSDGP